MADFDKNAKNTYPPSQRAPSGYPTNPNMNMQNQVQPGAHHSLVPGHPVPSSVNPQNYSVPPPISQSGYPTPPWAQTSNTYGGPLQNSNARAPYPPSSNMGGPPPKSNAPPPSSNASPYPPSSNMGGPPPTNAYPPSSNMGGPPPSSNAYPPSSNMGGPPPNSNARAPYPPSSNMGGPPSSNAPPPSSNARAPYPPSSNMGGPPPSSNAYPPSSNMGGAPPSSNARAPYPPSSNMGGPPPSSNVSAFPQARGPLTYPGMGIPSAPPGPPSMSNIGRGPPPPAPPGMGGVSAPHPISTQQHQPAAPVPPTTPPPRINPSQIPRVVWSEVGVVDAPWSSTQLLGPASDNKLLPPVCVKPFTAIDDGAATPRFIRPTLHHFPASKDVASATAQPLGVMLTPMARLEETEQPIPRADFSDPKNGGPVRCSRCKGYVNPFVTWLNNGESWGCNMCGMVNPTAYYYRCPVDGSGRRLDADARPELTHGSVDLIATPSYCVRPVQEPIYVFVVDATPASFLCGFTKLLVDTITQVVESTVQPTQQPMESFETGGNMPPLVGGARVKVAIVSFDQVVTFYRFTSEESICEVIMSDVNDPFAPLAPKDWLIPVESMHTRVHALGAHIQNQASIAANKALAAVQQGGQRLGASTTSKALPGLPSGCMTAALSSVASGLHKVGGRVLVFSHSAPLIGAGRLRPREHPNDYGTEREPHMWRALNPTAKAKEDKETGQYYAELADSCALRQVSVSMFMTDGGAYGRGGGADRRGGMGGWSDIATLGVVTTGTGGRMNFFPGSLDDEGLVNFTTAESLRGNLGCTLRAACADEAVLKIRCSEGFRCTDYLGPGVQHHPEEMEIAACDEWTSFYCSLKHDSAIKPNSRVYVQAALLYSSPEGLRMIRVHTLCLIAADQHADVFRLADLDAIFCANLQSSGSGNGFVPRALKQEPANLDLIREDITNSCVDALFSYRNTCATTSPAGQLVLPESLKLFPLYTLGLLKSLCFRENVKIASGEEPDPRADERSYQFLLLQHASPTVVHRLLQPRLFNLASFDASFVPSPASTPTNSAVEVENKPSNVMAPGSLPIAGAAIKPLNSNVLAGHRMTNGRIALPLPVHCSAASLAEDKVMLLDAGSVIYIWIGRSVDSIILLELFGVEELDPQAPPQTLNSGGEVVELIKAAIIELRRDIPFYAPLKIVASGPGSLDERRFLSLLIEDKTKHQISYVDFLCHIHRVIQRKM